MGQRTRWAVMVLAVVMVVDHGVGQGTTCVSVDAAGMQPSGGFFPDISADGRWVAFHSLAPNHVPGDTNATWDVFVHDRQTGTNTLTSVDSFGGQGNHQSSFPSISADGNFVAFSSMASNFGPGDTNGVFDVFVHARQTGRTTRVSVDSSGAQANGESFRPAISADGRYVAFVSLASNLVSSDSNATYDVFVHDRQLGETVRVSVDSAGGQADGSSSYPSISADGRRVAFHSYADHLVAGDTNGWPDIFVHDLRTRRTRRVSVESSGVEANGGSLEDRLAISADGRRVAFACGADNLVPGDTNGLSDLFVHDLATGVTERVSVDSSGAQANHSSQTPSLSADGRFVAFMSHASNLVPGDTNGVQDIFIRDLQSGETRRVSTDSLGAQGNGDSAEPSISADGRIVAFHSDATNLVGNDANGVYDTFVRDEGPHQPLAFCFGDGTAAPCPCGNSGAPAHGCENSAGTGGGVLGAIGNSNLSSDTVILTTSGVLPTALSVFVQGTQSMAPSSFGDGLGCTGGARLRLYVAGAVLGVASAPQPGDASVSARSASLGGPIPLGTTRFYQTEYRDRSPSFCPSPAGDSWNVTSGLALVWSP